MVDIQDKRQGRINMRVSDRQEMVLRQAAEITGESLTGFVLGVATERAQEVLERSRAIEVSAEAFEHFSAALNAPEQDMPALRRYATKPSPIRSR